MCEPITLGAIAAAGTYLAAPAALGTVGSIALAATAGAGIMSAASAYQQGQYQSEVARNNATMAEYAAQDAQRRADDDAMKVRRQGDQIKGAQRAKLAASGLDLSDGTADDLQAQTDFFSQMDQNTARYNGARDAWALREQAKGYRAEGANAASAGALSAFSTVLATGGQVADRWYTATRKPATVGG